MPRMAQAPQKKVNPKLKQFLEEVNELCDKYQYTLQPQMQYTPQGIVPTLKVVDKIPEKTKPKAKKTVSKKKKK